jgi:Tol biopolymer transport system component
LELINAIGPDRTIKLNAAVFELPFQKINFSSKYILQEDVGGGYQTAKLTTDFGIVEKDTHGIIFCAKSEGQNYFYLSDFEFRIQKKLVESSDIYQSPQGSPDGTKIIFVSNRAESKDIGFINSDGSDQRWLTHNQAKNESPVWSPDNKEIIFVSDRDGNWEIYKMNVALGKETRLTNNSEEDIAPQWSPDGQRIVYVTYKNEFSQIWSMNNDGSQKICLAEEGSAPIWSPDGKKIAFVARENGKNQIYLMDADGRNKVKVSKNGGNNILPAFSPAGDQIIFLAQLPDADIIFISGTQIIKPKKLFSGTNVEALTFTKDGKKIIYGFESMNKNGEKDIGVYNLIINKTTYWEGNWGDNYDPAPIKLFNE